MSLRVAFVPTAGTMSGAFWRGIPLPRIFTWSIFKWAIMMVPMDRLKRETVSRLERARNLYENGEVGKIFLSGGKATGSVILMAEWLKKREVRFEDIISDDDSLQTGESAKNFVVWCLNNGGEEVLVVTSWYHIPRTIWEIMINLPEGSRVAIVPERVFPELTAECLLREYVYNILTEIPKIFLSLLPSFKRRYGEKELRARRRNQKKLP